jgi:hypothetical protein
MIRATDQNREQDDASTVKSGPKIGELKGEAGKNAGANTPLKIGLTVLHPSCILPIEGRSESKPFPSTGKGWIGVREPVTYASIFILCGRA